MKGKRNRKRKFGNKVAGGKREDELGVNAVVSVSLMFVVAFFFSVQQGMVDFVADQGWLAAALQFMTLVQMAVQVRKKKMNERKKERKGRKRESVCVRGGLHV